MVKRLNPTLKWKGKICGKKERMVTMIKNQYVVRIMIAGLLTLSLTGCASSSQQATTTGQSSSSTGTGAGQTGSLIDQDQPNRSADVYGKVKSIQGNVVLIAEMQPPASSLSAADKVARQQQMQSLSPEDRQKLLASQDVMTGKNITITVPVGIPVKLRIIGSNGPTVEDGAISSIKAGSVVNIWTGTSDPSLAEYVTVANR